jgi:hypothetical protein
VFQLLLFCHCPFLVAAAAAATFGLAIAAALLLQAGNVLLKLEVGPATAATSTAAAPVFPSSSSSEVVVAKVADLGLACLLDEQDTHISGVHRVRI